MKRWFLIVLAACGDNAAPSDAPPDVHVAATDAAPQAALCKATFSGNFSLSETLPANCGTVSDGSGGTTLAFDVAAPPIGSDVAIQFVLGSPAPDTYNSDTVTQWSATATQVLAGASRCYYVAGATSTPPGTFTLTLSAIGSDTAHGQLSLELAVLQGAENDCGSDNFEDLALTF
ncbi:MAG TPA: hypothetical protein VGL61_03945 [Kofleriaceae bacterium]|jgi:hypothetical protein